MKEKSQGFASIVLVVFLFAVAITTFFVVKKYTPSSHPSESKPEERQFPRSLFEETPKESGVTPTPPITPSPTRKPLPIPKPTAAAKILPTISPSQTFTPTQPPSLPTKGVVEGYVKKATGEPAGTAAVEIFCECTTLRGGASETTQADSNGYYRFNDVLPGQYRIQGFYGNWSQIYNFSIEAGKTARVDISLSADPATVPQTTIISGSAPRTDPGDPPNFYCTTVRITVQKCCVSMKIALSYDNSNPPYVALGTSCTTDQQTYLCQVLSSGSHKFYYHAKNEYCGEESIKSTSFNVP